MTRVWIVVLGLVALSLPPGCDRDTDPPPQFTAEGGKLPPIRVSERVGDKSIVASVAGGERSSSAAPAPLGDEELEPAEPTEPAGPIEIDDSTAEAAAGSYLQLMSAGQIDRAAGLLVPGQREVAEKMAPVAMPMIEATRRFEQIWERQFPGEPIDPEGKGSPLEQMGVGQAYTNLQVEMDSDDPDKAQATVEIGQESKTLELSLVDGAWRVKDPELPEDEAGAQMMTAIMGPMLQAMSATMSEVGDRIEAGEFPDADAARKAMQETMGAKMGDVAPPGGGN